VKSELAASSAEVKRLDSELSAARSDVTNLKSRVTDLISQARFLAPKSRDTRNAGAQRRACRLCHIGELGRKCKHIMETDSSDPVWRWQRQRRSWRWSRSWGNRICLQPGQNRVTDAGNSF